MKRYRNLSGDSGVVAYEIGRDWIRVKFRKKEVIYTYTYARPGAPHVEAMKRLAIAGRGLCTYISQNVREAYESKDGDDPGL